MSQQFDTNNRPFTADAAIAMYARVKKTSTGVAAAGADEASIGTATREAFAAGDVIDVKLWTAAGTHKVVATEAITEGASVYGAASGEVAADGSSLVGVAMEAATADNDVIEIMASQAGGAAGTGGYLAVAQEAATVAGALSVATYYTSVNTTTGTGHASTLANGTYAGQLKKVQLIVDAGDLVLTPASFTNGTTLTFADAGDYAIFVWDGDSWTAIELGNDADGATAPVVA